MARGYIRPGTVYEIAKQTTHLRISEESIRLLAEFLTEQAKEIVKEAEKIATHSKRKTIKKEDIKFVIDNF